MSITSKHRLSCDVPRHPALVGRARLRSDQRGGLFIEYAVVIGVGLIVAGAIGALATARFPGYARSPALLQSGIP
jgi:hypothetical protein